VRLLLGSQQQSDSRTGLMGTALCQAAQVTREELLGGDNQIR